MSTIAVVSLPVLIGYPLGFSVFLMRNWLDLRLKSMKNKYKEFYVNLNLRNGEMVLLQPLWFLYRRLILAVIVVFLGYTVIWQISLMTFTVITQVIILGRVAPFISKEENSYEIFNECIVMLIMYHLIYFTPFVPSVELRFKLGY